MPTYPLPTLAATVSATGISAPSYADIFASLQASFQGIYGADVYLGADSQDGQLLAIVAQAIFDCNSTAIAVYNQFSPATSQGTGLSSVVKINGIARQIPSSSTVDLQIVGQAGTTILSGLVGDNVNLGTQWSLPATVTIPYGGAITVTATSTTIGDVAAAPSTLTEILTPTPGWQTVNNSAAATPGSPVETDAQLRRRQSLSTALPAETVIEAIAGNVANVAGVERLAVYQNDTNTVDVNGIPVRSISVVVEGGDAIVIATAIAEKKAPGVPTYGTTSELIYDSLGVPNHINFFRLAVVETSFVVFAKALVGYVDSTGVSLKGAIAQFESALEIGEDSYLSRIWAPAGLNGDAATASTGFNQAQLDALALTYSINAPYGIGQARSDMNAVAGPYTAGTTAIDVNNPDNYFTNSVLYLPLDDDTFLTATCTSVVGATVHFTPAVPALRNVPIHSLIYVVGDLIFAFNEAAQTVAADVTLLVT